MYGIRFLYHVFSLTYNPILPSFSFLFRIKKAIDEVGEAIQANKEQKPEMGR